MKGMIMRTLLTIGAVTAIGLGLCSCGGSGYGSGNSGTPTAPTSPGQSGAVTVNIVGINGALSFSPNPASLAAGQVIVWHNIDSVTHHVLLNDGSLDTGDLAPGGFSSPQTISASGGGYHCTIHPVMVGSVNQATATTTPCPNAYCY
jgi:plastocyanin